MIFSFFKNTKRILPYVNVCISSVGLYYQTQLQKKLEKSIEKTNEIFAHVKKNTD